MNKFKRVFLVIWEIIRELVPFIGPWIKQIKAAWNKL